MLAFSFILFQLRIVVGDRHAARVTYIYLLVSVHELEGREKRGEKKIEKEGGKSEKKGSVMEGGGGEEKRVHKSR